MLQSIGSDWLREVIIPDSPLVLGNGFHEDEHSHSRLQTFLSIAANSRSSHGYDEDVSYPRIFVLPNLPRSIIAIKHWHLDVHQHLVEGSSIGTRLLQSVDSLLSIRESFAFEAQFLNK